MSRTLTIGETIGQQRTWFDPKIYVPLKTHRTGPQSLMVSQLGSAPAILRNEEPEREQFKIGWRRRGPKQWHRRISRKVKSRCW